MEKLLHTLATDFDGLPLYVALASDGVPADLLPSDCIGYTGLTLDLVLRDWLGARWQGRGVGIVLNDNLIRAHLGEDETIVEQWIIGILLHEVAHCLEQPFDICDIPDRGLAIGFARQWCSLEPSSRQSLSVFGGHDAVWIRNCVHLVRRYEVATGRRLPLSLLFFPYGLSSPWTFRRLLGDEPARFSQLSFAEIRQIAAPAAFTARWESDLHLVQKQSVEVEVA